MKQNTIKINAFDFLLNIMEVHKALVESNKKFILGRQLLRWGISIGAIVKESEHSESKNDLS